MLVSSPRHSKMGQECNYWRAATLVRTEKSLKFASSHRFRTIPNSVVADVVEDEAVIINVETGIYYSTEGCGGWIWSNVAAGVPIGAITAALEAASPEFEIEAALDRFLAELIEEKLIETAESGAEEVQSAPQKGAEPKLVIYRDMQDLMALDPPMPILDEQPD